jgi:hypothetical protein
MPFSKIDILLAVHHLTCEKLFLRFANMLEYNDAKIQRADSVIYR